MLKLSFIQYSISQPLGLKISPVILSPLILIVGLILVCIIPRLVKRYHGKYLCKQALKTRKNRFGAVFLLTRVRITQFLSCLGKRRCVHKEHCDKEIPLQNEPVLRATTYEIKTVYPIIMPDEAPNIFKPGELTVDDLNKDLEPFGFAYYPQDDIFYSIMDGWQRDCGYCQLYDEACATLSMIIDCEPIYFEYAGKRWLIEFWKGQYGMNTGCEIGVYNTTGSDVKVPGVFNGTFYYCANNEDHLVLGFRLKKFGKLLVKRKQLHWWLTCFVLGEFSHPGNLIMDCEVTFKDIEMRDAFLGGMYRAGYDKEQLNIQDKTVSFVYDKPKARQPIARNQISEFIMQTNNHRNCRAYNDATIGYTDSLDKINFIKKQAPKKYKKILNIGSTKEIYKLFDLFKDYLELPERPIDTYGVITSNSSAPQTNAVLSDNAECRELKAEETGEALPEKDTKELKDKTEGV